MHTLSSNPLYNTSTMSIEHFNFLLIFPVIHIAVTKLILYEGFRLTDVNPFPILYTFGLFN
jgi:hypothetical protein